MENNQGNKKPFYKKWWFWVIVVCVLLVIVVGSGGDVQEDADRQKAFTEENDALTNGEDPVNMTPETAGGETENTEEESESADSGTSFPSITSDEEAGEYMNSCIESINWSDLLRYEEDYKGMDFTFVAEVSQVMSDGDLVVYDDADGNGIYGDNAYYIVDKRTWDTTKILEGDRIMIFGRYMGSTTLESAIGGTKHSEPELYMYLCEFMSY